MSISLALHCSSTGGHEAAVTSWQDTMEKPWGVAVDDTTEGEGAGYLQKVEKFRTMTDATVIGYLHSDLFTLEHAWDQRVLAEFHDPQVAIVSFGGSLRHGARDIYKVPYDYRQLVRSTFLSNMVDAERHGAREPSVRNVAVVDSMALFVRRAWLDAIGGWPVGTYPPSHVSDYWLCLMAHRHRMRIRMVGCRIMHTSGGVGRGTFDYPKWAASTKWQSDANMHQIGHRMIYEEFRDVLPVEVL